MNLGLLTLKTLRDLRRARGQSAALISVLALGVATFVAAIGAYLDLDASEARTFERLRFADAWYELEPTDVAVVDEVVARPDVAAAAARLVVDTGLPVGEADRVRARVIGVPPGDQAVNEPRVIEGNRLSRPGQVLVERHFAERRGIEPGDIITPLVGGRALTLEVAGTVASPEYLQVTPDRFELLPAPSSFAVLFMALPELQSAANRPGKVNDLAIRSTPGAGDGVIDEIERDLRTREVLRQTTRRAEQATYAALEQDLTAFRSIAVAMPSLILLAGVVSVAVLLGRIVRSQRPLIGVMKAVGHPDGAVLRHYLTYALVLGGAGSLVGLAAGTALAGVITRGYSAQLGIPFTETRFHPVVAGLAISITLLAVSASAARPAWKSARIRPALAVTVDVAPTGAGRRGRLEARLALPFALRVSVRSLRRSPGRTAGTVLGIATASVLVLMVLGLRDGINLFLQRTFDDLERWDVAATFDEPQPAIVAETVRGLPGVEDASPFLQVPAEVSVGDKREGILLTALDPRQQLRGLRLGEVSPAEALRDDAIVLTAALAEKLGVSRGEKVRLNTPIGAADLAVSGTSDEPIPARAYLSLTAAAILAGAETAPVNGLHLATDAQGASSIRTQLFDLPGVESVKLREEQRDDLASFLTIFTAIMAVMLAFAVAMAFALVFNTTTINVLEREREYATMRSLGTQPGAIARQLAAEALLLWLLALLPGMVAGTWVARRVGDAVAAGLFDLPVELTPLSYAGTAVGILAINLAALTLPFRRIVHLDLAQSTKTLA